MISGKLNLGRNKTRAADVRRRLADEERDISPFAQIKLKEKKTVPEKKKPETKKIQTKRPAEIVQGYNPSASFADILYSYEHTGNPYSMPKPKASSKSGKKTDFGAIPDKWEGKKPAKTGKDTPVKKSEYKPTKSFSEILSSFEGVPVVKKETPAEKEKKTVVKEAEIPLSETTLFKKPEEGEERSATAVWSIYGDNRIIERPVAEKKEEEKKEKKDRKEKKASYEPKLSFSEILSSYEKGAKPKKVEVKPEIKEEEPVATPSLFKRPENGEERSAQASWSIYGGNDSFVRKTEAVEKSDDPSLPPIDSYKPTKPFSEILSSYTPEEKTFEELLKEKGDDAKPKVQLTISKLRTMMPQSTLDLHGFTQQEAENAVHAFLTKCHEHGLRKISIITGKGLHSEDGVSVIRDAVELILTRSDLVSEKSGAPRNAGGTGAFWIILKA